MRKKFSESYPHNGEPLRPYDPGNGGHAGEYKTILLGRKSDLRFKEGIFTLGNVIVEELAAVQLAEELRDPGCVPVFSEYYAGGVRPIDINYKHYIALRRVANPLHKNTRFIDVMEPKRQDKQGLVFDLLRFLLIPPNMRVPADEIENLKKKGASLK